VPVLLQNLLLLCTSARCDREAAYVGAVIEGRANHVNRNPAHKWHNAAYIRHAGVYQYLPYAFGGGYALSLDVCQARSHALVTWHTPAVRRTRMAWCCSRQARSARVI
jgi:hypothetical protein